MMTPALERILKELRYCPTIITDRRSFIVGWNEAAKQVFLDFEKSHRKREISLNCFFQKRTKSISCQLGGLCKRIHFHLSNIFRTIYGR